MDLQQLIFDLCEAQGVSGSEGAAAAVAARALAPMVRGVTRCGSNLVAELGNPDADRTILLDAHLDRIGFIVTDINEERLARAEKIFPPAEAAKKGIFLKFVNTSSGDARQTLMELLP